MNEDVLDGQGRDFCNENTAEGVCDRCVEADKGERSFKFIIAVKFDFEVLLENMRILTLWGTFNVLRMQNVRF